MFSTEEKITLKKKGLRFLVWFKFLMLFFMPAIISGYWYYIEYEKFHPFINIETRGDGNISEVGRLANAVYESTKDKNSFQFSDIERKSTEYRSFNLKVSEGVVEKLGIFSSLPYHKVCLINRNKIFVDGVVYDSQNIGATAINQENGYNFYAERGKKDCKSVSIVKFRQSASSPELQYAFIQEISPEDNQKRVKGEAYSSSFKNVTVVATSTTITISLQWRAVFFAYLAILFAWSFVFFQYVKIMEYSFKVRESEDE